MPAVTMLVFMAADNDLETFAIKDLHEMERVGSTDKVSVVVQVDMRGDGVTGVARRGRILKDPAWSELPNRYVSDLGEIGETNTGDPATLAEFIAWGIESYPAEVYILIIWNHGSGWKPEFLGVEVDAKVGPDVGAAIKGGSFVDHFKQRTRRTLFRKTAVRELDSFIYGALLPLVESNEAVFRGPVTADDLIVRAIGLDESSGNDALDTIELAKALRAGLEAVRQRSGENVRFSLLGFDGCLMAGVEVAYEVRDFCDMIAASEEVEPSTGWPYHLVLEALSGGSIDDLRAFGEQCIHSYIVGLSSYKIRLVTQSLLKCRELDDVCALIDRFALDLIARFDSAYMDVAKAEKQATRFFDRDYVDLGDFIGRIIGMLGSDDPAQAAAVLETCVLANEFAFNAPSQKPTGLSIYFPVKPVINEGYFDLAFDRASPSWRQLLSRYHFLPEAGAAMEVNDARVRKSVGAAIRSGFLMAPRSLL